jgi:hypothetical protein
MRWRDVGYAVALVVVLILATIDDAEATAPPAVAEGRR